jgi:hypothetical protein
VEKLIQQQQQTFSLSHWLLAITNKLYRQGKTVCDLPSSLKEKGNRRKGENVLLNKRVKMKKVWNMGKLFIFVD